LIKKTKEDATLGAGEWERQYAARKEEALKRMEDKERRRFENGFLMLHAKFAKFVDSFDHVYNLTLRIPGFVIETIACSFCLRPGRQQSCPPKALESLFEPPLPLPPPPDFF
jgi:molybdopterin-biosynthesis enzyme MoeA-like protein